VRNSLGSHTSSSETTACEGESKSARVGESSDMVREMEGSRETPPTLMLWMRECGSRRWWRERDKKVKVGEVVKIEYSFTGYGKLHCP
jgi:hypothetical protein